LCGSASPENATVKLLYLSVYKDLSTQNHHFPPHILPSKHSAGLSSAALRSHASSIYASFMSSRDEGSPSELHYYRLALDR
jgi:hypothetical protein